jgi:hypothetical protein
MFKQWYPEQFKRIASLINEISAGSQSVMESTRYTNRAILCLINNYSDDSIV